MWKKADFAFILFVFAFLYLHLFVLPSVPIFYEEDHLIFANDAWRMSLGEAIYRDFFQLTFPGTQVLYLGLLHVFGTSYFIINAVVILHGISQTVIWLAISKRMFGNTAYVYLPASIFMFFGFRWFGLDGSHRMLSPLFIGLAIFVMLMFKGYGRLLLAGLFSGLTTFFTQQRGVILVGAIALFLIFESLKNRSGWKHLIKEEVVLLCAFLFSIFFLISPFIAAAGAETFFSNTVLYLENYARGSISNNYLAFLDGFGNVFDKGILIGIVTSFYYLLVPLVYIGAFIYLLRRKYCPEALLISMVGFLLAFGSIAPNAHRMFQIAFPGLTVFTWLIFQIKLKSDLAVKVAVILLIVFGLALAVRVQLGWNRFYLNSPTGTIVFLSDATFERYKWLSDRTQPNDYLFEAYEPAVNFPLQLRNPTAVMLVWNDAFTPDSHVAEAIYGMEKNKPKFVLWDGKWSKEKFERKPEDRLAPLYDYLREKYEPVQNFTPYNGREMQMWKRIE